MSSRRTWLLFAALFPLQTLILAAAFQSEIRGLYNNSKVDWVLPATRSTLVTVLRNSRTLMITDGPVKTNLDGTSFASIRESELAKLSSNRPCEYLKQYDSVIFYATDRRSETAAAQAEYYAVLCARAIYLYHAEPTQN